MIELTNTYTQQLASLKIKKTFDGVPDGTDVSSLNFKITKPDGSVENVTYEQFDANGEYVVAENVPVNQTYSVEETNADGLVANYNLVTASSTTSGEKTLVEGVNVIELTNTYERKLSKLTVKKIWEGDDIGDEAKAALKIKITGPDAGGEGIDTLEVTYDKFTDGSYTVENLPVGESYSVTEENADTLVEHYTLVASESTTATASAVELAEDGETVELKNTYSGLTDVSVYKIWKDENDANGKRPLKLIVYLMGNDSKVKEVELTAANGWMATVKNLPRCDDDGNEIEYTWEEDTPVGYKLESRKTTGSLTTLTNVLPPEETSISVHKVWDDQDNAGGTRPKEIKVQLFANGKAQDDPAILNAGNGWSYTWKGLAKNCNPSGDVGGSKAIVYTVEEIEVPSGYQVSVTGDAKNGFVITNSTELGKLEIRKKFKYGPAEEEHNLEALVSIPVLKVWDDNDNKDQNRPESVTVRLYAGGQEIDCVRLSEANGWAHTFKDLPKYKDNKTIRYSVSEDPTDMYTAQISGSAENGYTIVNEYSPQTTSVAVRKIWDDNDNEMLIRPVSIRMTLSNGMNVILNEANGWTAVIDNLPAIVDGKPAVYTWTEQEVPGYKLESKVTNGILTTFTNRAVKLVEIPPDQPQPRMPGGGWVIFEEYDTALGGELLINHVGDCFD